MAKQTTVTLADDLDGSADAKEVTFSLDGESWTIGLGVKNRNALEKALKPYILASIRIALPDMRELVSRTPSTAPSSRSVQSRSSWASSWVCESRIV